MQQAAQVICQDGKGLHSLAGRHFSFPPPILLLPGAPSKLPQVDCVTQRRRRRRLTLMDQAEQYCHSPCHSVSPGCVPAAFQTRSKAPRRLLPPRIEPPCERRDIPVVVRGSRAEDCLVAARLESERIRRSWTCRRLKWTTPTGINAGPTLIARLPTISRFCSLPVSWYAA